MIKKLVIALLLVSFSANAQDTLHVKMEPVESYKWMMLYKINGAKQQYVSNVNIDNGEFKLPFPEGSTAGMYRAFYDMDRGGYLDFLYNKESVSVTFNPDIPEQSAVFEKSEENKIYQTYLNSIHYQQSKVDSLQMTYFEVENKKLTTKSYAKQLKELATIQDYFEEKSEGKLAQEFIKTGRKYNSPKLIETPEEYLKSIKTHFFDHIDFDNKALANSSVFVDKAIEYIFYINDSEDPEMYKELRKKGINDVMKKADEKHVIKSEILSALMHAFAGQEQIELVDFIKEEHYDLLPAANRDSKFIEEIEKTLSLAVSRVAPEITWPEGEKTMKLSELDGSEKYIVTFWSTTCSHCLKEIPELYEFTKEMDSVKVIAIALEKDKFGFEYHTELMDKWINVLGLNKWENEIARNYEIHSTPSYFVLDKDKKITSKPEQLEDLLKLLGKE